MKFALAKCSLKPVQQDEENANIEQEFPFKKKTSPLSPTAASPPSSSALYRHPVADLIFFCKKTPVRIDICDIKRDL